MDTVNQVEGMIACVEQTLGYRMRILFASLPEWLQLGIIGLRGGMCQDR